MSRLALILALAGTVAACAGPAKIRRPTTAGEPMDRYLLATVPFFPQKAYQCGPAALAMLLTWSGLQVSPQTLTPFVFTPAQQGSLQSAMIAAARRHDRIAYLLTDPASLSEEIAAGHPVVVLQNLGLSWYPVWHYAVVIGIDFTDGSVILHSGTTPCKRISMETFVHTWSRSDYWGMLVMPPSLLPAAATQENVLRAIGHHERLGRWDTARRGYQAVLGRWPHSLAATVGVGVCLYRSGDLVAAETVFRGAVLTFPGEGVVFNNLAHVLDERGQRAEAIAAAERAVELGGPLKAQFQNTLQEIRNR